jgi:hypothetical protein
MVVFAGVVPPVGLPGAALGGDEGAVDQDHLPAPFGDLLQDAVQARGLRGEQGDQLVAPSADGGHGDVVAAGHVGQALVVAQHGQDDHRDPSGRQDPPPGPYRLQMTTQQTGEVVDGPRGQRQTALVDKRAGALGAFFGFVTQFQRPPGAPWLRPWRSTPGDGVPGHRRVVKRPSGSLRSQPRSTRLTSFPRSGSSPARTVTSAPSISPTWRAMTGPAACRTAVRMRW